MTKQIRTGALGAACLLAAGGAWAEEGGGQPAMSAEEQAMMEAWNKAAKTMPHHAWLMESAGEWHVKQTLWMQPGAEPMTSEGKARREALLGGRVLKEEFTSTFMEQPYEGLAHSGYDNVTGKYWVTWMDNMSTALYTGHGTCKDDRSHCSYKVTGTDPVTGGTYEMRIEVDFDDGGETHTFYEPRDGEEVKTMVMVYTPAE